jgi:hypothetical protein
MARYGECYKLAELGLRRPVDERPKLDTPRRAEAKSQRAGYGAQLLLLLLTNTSLGQNGHSVNGERIERRSSLRCAA